MNPPSRATHVAGEAVALVVAIYQRDPRLKAFAEFLDAVDRQDKRADQLRRLDLLRHGFRVTHTAPIGGCR